MYSNISKTKTDNDNINIILHFYIQVLKHSLHLTVLKHIPQVYAYLEDANKY